MKKISTLAALPLAILLAQPTAWAAGEDTYADFKAMMDGSFKTTGIAPKHRMYQLDFQKACSQEKQPAKEVMAKIEAEQMKTIRYPADGKYFGDWKQGEKIALSGRGLTWTDKTPDNNGGGCYNCHQMSHHEVSYGTIGTSLLEYGKNRGTSDDVVKYTWGKIYNAKAFNACSHMPRNGDAEILTEQQIKHLMAFLFDPASPVNKK
jgi:sulfur-oxidizing protein SoxX